MAVVVTGASRGIGKIMARALGANGVDVVLAARTRDQLTAVRDEIAGDGGTAMAIPCDVTVWDDVKHVMDETMAEFGQLDAVVNNAAVASTTIGAGKRPVMEQDIEIWWQIFDVNLHGVFHGCKAALEHMEPAGAGTLVNISSGRAHATPRSAYSISKLAVEALSQSIAAHYQDSPLDIRCLVLEPGGAVKTDFGAHESPERYEQRLEPDVMAQPIVDIIVNGLGENGRRLIATDPRLGGRDLI